MLKTPDPKPPEQDDEPSVGALVQRLFENGKAYAEAELDLAKAIAGAKLSALKVPAALLFAALLFAQATVTLLGVAIFLALVPLVGTLVAGLLAVLAAAGITGTLAWLGIGKLKDIL